MKQTAPSKIKATFKLTAPFAFLAMAMTMALSLTASAQSVIYQDDSGFPRVTLLNPLNEQFLIRQRANVDQITRKHFGQQLGNGKENKQLLQRLIDQNIIPKTDKLDLQAMGVVFGDLLVDSSSKLAWKLYEDELGISHAVCVDDTKHCIFPVTMISRRIEGGAKVDVERLYNKGLDSVKEYLPRLPFSR